MAIDSNITGHDATGASGHTGRQPSELLRIVPRRPEMRPTHAWSSRPSPSQSAEKYWVGGRHQPTGRAHAWLWGGLGPGDIRDRGLGGLGDGGSGYDFLGGLGPGGIGDRGLGGLGGLGEGGLRLDFLYGLAVDWGGG